MGPPFPRVSMGRSPRPDPERRPLPQLRSTPAPAVKGPGETAVPERHPFQDPIPEPLRRAMFEELVQRKGWMQLVRPNHTVEGRAFELGNGVLNLRVHLSLEALRPFKGQDLVLRWPWNLTMLEGPTRMVEMEAAEKVSMVRMALPASVTSSERRQAYRIEHADRSRATLELPDGTAVHALVESLSGLGAGLFCLEALRDRPLHPGQVLPLQVELEAGPRFQTQARIQHMGSVNLGLSFHPVLEPLTLAALQEWMAPRRREAQLRWDNRDAVRAEAEKMAFERRPPKGTLLITRDPALARALAPALDYCGPVGIAIPSVGEIRCLLEAPPLLVVVDLDDLEGQARRRTRLLLETLAFRAPLVVVGRGANPPQGRAFANEVRADLYLDWDARKASILLRLIQGFIGRHVGTEDPAGKN